jgi:hypothetical protein
MPSRKNVLLYLGIFEKVKSGLYLKFQNKASFFEKNLIVD